jgi:hypothetical protein
MTKYMKIVMQYGSSTTHVLTVELPANRNQHIISLAHMGLAAVMQSRNINVNGHAENFKKVSDVLKESEFMQGHSRPAEVQAHSSLFVCGSAICPASDSHVVYGRAFLSVENIKLETSIPAVHIACGNDVSVTCILQHQTNYRDCKHFLVSGGQCKSLKDLNLGSRGEFRMLWPPYMSHYLRRTNTTNTHKLGFRNAHLCLNNTKHNTTQLFDYVTSQSNDLICISVFI